MAEGRASWIRRRRPADPPSRDQPEQERPAPRLRLVADDRYPDWEAIYRDNVHRVYRMMFAKVGNRPDAEDLTTEVFLAALGPLRTSASVGEVRAYLLATARTALARHWMRTLGREITELDPEQVADLLVAAPENHEATARADRILAGLPDRYRRILELRFLEACPIKEAAARMGISVANAKVLQFRALRQAAANERTTR
ncbi:RNA polymerase sigma factor [Dactylosporangium sp. McL0621]|uniref:RNA polymerase sigma factor n=1 Tax=Dactylosporangium sp. McL0621 TaxID=3415678 RepID=UPI003CED73BB